MAEITVDCSANYSAARSIFVYGSMTEGFVHFDKIKEFVEEQNYASIAGSAYLLKVGFPVVLAEGLDVIPGQLMKLKDNSLLWQLLDQFHGYHEQIPTKSLYFRQSIDVRLQNGETVRAETYFLNPSKLPSSAKLISGGDWRCVQQEKPLTEKLTDRQRSYILRLGTSIGREIVPIDLPLYRELMNLEMIVDKGRRLALSKLGHEVYRYLA